MKILQDPMHRRTMLRGFGVSMALPLLESMIPSKGLAAETSPMRLSIYYMPNGMIMQSFVPTTTGVGYALSPTLTALQAHQKDFAVLTGLACKNAEALGDGPGDHGRACGSYLTGVHVKKTEGFDLSAGVSMDQIVAKELGKQTQIGSLELGVEEPSFVGSCDSGYSCAYTNTMSWSSPNTPLPITVNPRDVFERLFGDADKIDPATRSAQMRREASILDFVMDSTGGLTKKLGADDKHKLDEYMTSVRDLEQRIQLAESGGGQGSFQSDMTRPSGAPDNFNDHVKLMIDLQVLAMRADLTRVSSLMIARELSNRSYTEIGISDAHHSISHHGGDPDKMAKLVRIQQLFLSHYGYYLQQLKEAKEGDHTLFDRTVAIGGSSMGDSNNHDHENIPAIIAGGVIKGNQHIAVAKGTTLSNVMLTAMNAVGVHRTSLGDSTGPMTELIA
jgi:hypothetical protein